MLVIEDNKEYIRKITAQVVFKNYKQKRYKNIDTSEDLLTFLKEKRIVLAVTLDTILHSHT